jgi:hypothetical protein
VTRPPSSFGSRARAPQIYLLGVQADVVGEAEKFVHQIPGFLSSAEMASASARQNEQQTKVPLSPSVVSVASALRILPPDRTELKKARGLRLRLHLLPRWYDVDTESDLWRLHAQLVAAGAGPPRTLAFVRWLPG